MTTPPDPRADVARVARLRMAQAWFAERARLCEGVEADLCSLADLLLTHAREARRLALEEAAVSIEDWVTRCVAKADAQPTLERKYDAIGWNRAMKYLVERLPPAFRAHAQATPGEEGANG